MPLSTEQAFKFGFLLRCADEGLSPEETQERIKTAAAIEKWGTIPALLAAPAAAGAWLWGTGMNVAGRVGSAALAASPALAIAGLAAPAAVGAAGGYAAAKLTSADRDELEQAKQDEVEGEYYRLAQEARRNAARKKLQNRTGGRVTLLSPGLG